MNRYSVTATVSVEVNLEILAGDREAAEALFMNGISMTANLVDTPPDEFEIWDDCISDIDDVTVHSSPST